MISFELWENFLVAMLLGLIIVLFGYFGGRINQLLEKSEDRGKSILFGIGASALVPLFLNLTESRLLTRLFDPSEAQPTEPYLKSLFVFASMCLLASIISERFIRTLSDQMLAKRIDNIEDQIENPEETEVPLETDEQDQVADAEQLKPQEAEVLNALMEKPNVWRARSPVAREVGFGRGSSEDRENLRMVLDDLVARGLADSRESPRDGKPRWRLAKSATDRLVRDTKNELFVRPE